jgi:Tfp pilus assembly protein PilW
VGAFLRRRGRSQLGITVAELAISMMIFSLIGGLAVSGLSSSSRSLGQVDDEVQGLADLRVVSERLSRDLRQARGIDATSNANQVTIWIDVNADYKQTDPETVTWKLVGPNDGLYDVVRVDKTGLKSIIGHSLVSDIAFSYDPAPPKTRVVTVEMRYDAMPFRYATERKVHFESRLRNVP